MINLRENIWAVEVPDKIANPHLYRVNNSSIMLKWDDIERPLNPHDLVKVDTYYGNLDDYKWPEIVCTSKEATEEQAASIVDSVDSDGRGKVYMNYNNGMYVFHRSTSSLRTLLASKGCDTKQNWLIVNT